MTQWSCEFEEQTALAAASGQWSDTLAQHAQACEVCLIVRLIAELDQQPMHQAIPSVEIIWWKHQLNQRAGISHRKMEVIDIYERSAALLLMITLVAVGVLAVHAQWKSGPSLLIEAMTAVAAIICVAALAGFSITSSQAKP